MHQNGENSFKLMHQKKKKNGRSSLRLMHQTGNFYSVILLHCHGISTVSRSMHQEGVAVCSAFSLVRPQCGHHLGDDYTFRAPGIGETPPEKRKQREKAELNWRSGIFQYSLSWGLFKTLHGLCTVCIPRATDKSICVLYTFTK